MFTCVYINPHIQDRAFKNIDDAKLYTKRDKGERCIIYSPNKIAVAVKASDNNWITIH